MSAHSQEIQAKKEKENANGILQGHSSHALWALHRDKPSEKSNRIQEFALPLLSGRVIYFLAYQEKP
jgi:hypothetical protein